MFRGKVEEIIGQVSDSEFSRACDITTYDIKGNHIWLKKKTTPVYIINTLITAILMIRRG